MIITKSCKNPTLTPKKEDLNTQSLNIYKKAQILERIIL